MQLLKQVPKDILSSITFPLILSLTTCCLIETIISFVNSDISAPYWQINNQSLEPPNSLLITTLKNLGGLMMNSSHSYFDFMGIMLILQLSVIIIQLSQQYLKKRSPMILLETQKEQKPTQQENSFQKQKPTRSQYQCEIPNFKKKSLKYLLYFTFSYYLCQLITNSSRLIFVGAKNIPIQEHDILFNERILEEQFQGFQEKQEIFSDIINSQQQGDFQDRLPVIKKTERATSVVVSEDGNKIFQLLPTDDTKNTRYKISGMDISDPLEIKYYPSVTPPIKGVQATLLLSSDARTLFLVTWHELHIYNISHIRSPPKYVSTTNISTSENTFNNKSKPVAALSEIENVIIIANNNLNIVNLADLQNPVIQSWLWKYWKPTSIALLSWRTVLVGTEDGLEAFDLSNLRYLERRMTTLGGKFVFSISISSNQSTVMIGVLNQNLTEAKNETWNASLSIYIANKRDLEYMSYNRYHRLISIGQLKTCRVIQGKDSPFISIPDIKATPDLEFAYWACNQDYGYVDIAEERVARFLAQKTIYTMALAQNNKVLLKMDSGETNLHALYQNFQKNDPFILKPVSISRLKLSPSAKVVASKSDSIVYIINSNSTLQIYNTSGNNFSLISTIELEKKPLSFIPSKDGKRFYMKTDEKTIQIYDISTQKLVSIDFFTTISEFVVSPDDQIIFATQENGQNTIILFASIKNLSSPSTDYLLVQGKQLIIPGSAKLLQSPGWERLAIFNQTGFIFIDAATVKNGEIRYKPYISDESFDSAISLFGSEWMFIVENNKNLKQKTLTFLSPDYHQPSVPIPYLAGNLPAEISRKRDLYLSTPEHLLEIESFYSLSISRIMKLSLKQFSLTGDDRFMYAVIGDDLEILDLRSKYALASLKEDFLLGASEKVDLQLLERTGQSKWNPVYKKHKFLTANFYKASITSDENEPVISYSVLPNWINFDKDTAEITIESRLPSHLGPYKIYTTGSFQLPSSLSFLNDSDHLIADLIDRGYLDEERFLTTKFNAYKKLTLSPQYSQFESDIRYFLRNYATDQEFAFKVTSSLFLRQYPPHLEIETQSSHYTTARIVLSKAWTRSGWEATPKFVQRTYSSCRNILNQDQTELTFDGTLLNINEALAEIIIDTNYADRGSVLAVISISDSLNRPVETRIDASKYFRINAYPIANPDPDLSIQSQVNKSSLVSGQFFNIHLHPKTYLDVNERPLEYSLSKERPDWLEIRGLTLTGTPPKRLWPFQVSVWMDVSNEFKSEEVLIRLEFGMSTVILMQYVILYFGYAFSGYKAYKHLPKFYNISAQKFYRYPKTYQIPVNQEVNDHIITPIGFFGKEFENADLLHKHLKKCLIKELNKSIPTPLINYLKDEQGPGLDKNKLITSINQLLENLTFEERHSLKYYIQVDDDQKDLIHQIIIDKIILSRISLWTEKLTFNIFKKVKNQWMDIVEMDDICQPYFKVNRSKLNYVLQNLGSKTRPSVSSNAQKDGLLDMTQSSIRSRYMSNSHLFEKSVSDVEESLLDSNLSMNSQLKNVNIELLEWALQAHAFKEHHMKAQREEVTIISKERKVGSSCFYKIKALLRRHLQTLQSSNKEDIGYGLKYMLQKNVLHFCGTPESRMEFETLVLQFLNKREMIMREIYIFGAENKNRRREHIEQVQEQL